ncbi:MAG TPA: hypothetical protein VFA76_17865 [Terriglobales bacterium]|nr:hypothetical protein [Terriglobales bacterium]
MAVLLSGSTPKKPVTAVVLKYGVSVMAYRLVRPGPSTETQVLGFGTADFSTPTDLQNWLVQHSVDLNHSAPIGNDCGLYSLLLRPRDVEMLIPQITRMLRSGSLPADFRRDAESLLESLERQSFVA